MNVPTKAPALAPMRILRPVLACAAGLLPAFLPPPAVASGRELTSSYVCGECHRDIYRAWLRSAHSLSFEEPAFLDTYRETEAREGSEVAQVCLSCHAPVAGVNGDTAMLRKVTWEGVNCDFCHSLVAVDLSGPRPRMRLDVGAVKRGPIREAASSAHEVAYSELHRRSLVCAPCHEYVNPEGTAIMTTYSEWTASRAAAEGRPCQACHMGLMRANVVDPRIERVSHAEINLHEVPGGHSLEQLHKALSVGIEPKRAGGHLNLQVVLVNKGAGHAVPTGMPGRRVILDVDVATSEGRDFHERRVYEKTLTGAGGKPVSRDGGSFATGVRLASDTRIRADERRSERFRFPLPRGVTAFVTVKLHYEHSPRGNGRDRTWITFLSETRVVRPAPSGAGA